MKYTLYKRNTNDSTQFWTIEHNEKSYWTFTGKYPDGEVIKSAPTWVTAKGSKTLQEQVESEVASKIKKQIDKKYVSDLKEIDLADSRLDGYEPMLAHVYQDHKEKIKFPCAIQPKLDGLRCIMTKDGMFSRKRKRYTSCQHIWDELKPFFAKFPNAILDGELYTHLYKNDFGKICSAVKKSAEKASSEDLKLQSKIEYWVYDTPKINKLDEDSPFIERYSSMATELSFLRHVKVVPTIFNIKNEDELVEAKVKFIGDGFEGGMARNINMKYENKRSYNLLKLKDMMDAEFEIIGIEEGNGKLKDAAASFICKMPADQKGGIRTFNCKMRGTDERLKEIWKDKDSYIGKVLTVKYQNLTDKDFLPRFPIGLEIRDYE